MKGNSIEDARVLKARQFKRKSKGAQERDARRYIQNKQGFIKLVFAK